MFIVKYTGASTHQMQQKSGPWSDSQPFHRCSTFIFFPSICGFCHKYCSLFLLPLFVRFSTLSQMLHLYFFPSIHGFCHKYCSLFIASFGPILNPFGDIQRLYFSHLSMVFVIVHYSYCLFFLMSFVWFLLNFSFFLCFFIKLKFENKFWPG